MRDGAIDYIEFGVRDMEESKRFYSEAFGWQFTDYAPTYAGIQRDGGGESGGFTVQDPIQTGGPLVVLRTDDLEQALANVQKAGGEIVTEPFSFPGGRRFHFRDPNGHELAVWIQT